MDGLRHPGEAGARPGRRDQGPAAGAQVDAVVRSLFPRVDRDAEPPRDSADGEGEPLGEVLILRANHAQLEQAVRPLASGQPSERGLDRRVG